MQALIIEKRHADSIIDSAAAISVIRRIITTARAGKPVELNESELGQLERASGLLAHDIALRIEHCAC